MIKLGSDSKRDRWYIQAARDNESRGGEKEITTMKKCCMPLRCGKLATPPSSTQFRLLPASERVLLKGS